METRYWSREKSLSTVPESTNATPVMNSWMRGISYWAPAKKRNWPPTGVGLGKSGAMM